MSETPHADGGNKPRQTRSALAMHRSAYLRRQPGSVRSITTRDWQPAEQVIGQHWFWPHECVTTGKKPPDRRDFLVESLMKYPGTPVLGRSEFGTGKQIGINEANAEDNSGHTDPPLALACESEVGKTMVAHLASSARTE
eukprot:823079-Rhodomonas_salina.1